MSRSSRRCSRRARLTRTKAALRKRSRRFYLCSTLLSILAKPLKANPNEESVEVRILGYVLASSFIPILRSLVECSGWLLFEPQARHQGQSRRRTQTGHHTSIEPPRAL